MRYSKSDSEYFRNKKGGGLQTNGKLNASNFIINNIDSKQEIVRRTNTNSSITGFELQRMNNSKKFSIYSISKFNYVLYVLFRNSL